MASTVNIKQLTSRLESSVSAERIDALQELQALSRTSPDAVGEISLRNVFDLLRSQSSSEEYSEALDLTSRLIKTRDRDAAMKNTERILSEGGNVELLLDLLEHSDLMVGVMTSEILTELHTNDREGLEAQIQQCPDGMNKLLQRLPDSSREEVRNQAIVLIQQLTSRNEEMKKTVVFNEGFDILFRIISEEGGATEANLVVSDCLKICNNILMDSETCQRLFYAMGTEWIFRLADFFNPMILETMEINYNSLMDQDSNQTACWFDESNRLSCAVLAIAILSNSLQFHNAKHQSVIADNAAQVLQSAMYWIGRNGPFELLVASLSLLDAVVASNVNIAHTLSAMFVKLTPNSKGKNISLVGEVATLQYAWRPLPTDERRCISLLALLAERYAIPCKPWRAPATSIIHGDLGFHSDYDVWLQVDQGDNSNNSNTTIIINPFLLLFHRIMSVDSMIPDTSVQYVLAPPPPPMGMGDEDGDDMYQASPAVLESMRPVCSILLQNLIQFCEKLLSGHMVQFSPATMKHDIEGVERLFHLLTVVFMNASLLGRELSTAILTSHCVSHLDGQDKRLREMDAENKAIVPFVLSAVGRAARLPGGVGFPLVKASMVWLATVVCGCERATRMVFEDPANLFVVDLATASSESAGVPSYVQVSACFFLACCLLALPAENPDQENAQENSSAGVLKRKSFLTVIDSKIGLNRFTETLKKPLVVTRKPMSPADNFFFIPDFRTFYEAQVQNVKDVIFEMYSSGGANGSGVEALHLQTINVQKAKIQELEDKLREFQGKSAASSHSTVNMEEVYQLNTLLQSKEEELSTSHATEETLSLRLQESLSDLQNEISKTDELRGEMKDLQQVLNEREAAMQELIGSNESLIAQHHDEAVRWREKEAKYEEMILMLKESVLTEAKAKKSLEEAIEQKDKKIFLLESELTELQASRPEEQAQMSDSRQKILQLEEQVHELNSEMRQWQRQCEKLQQEMQENAHIVTQAIDENAAKDARAQSLEEAIRVLQSELHEKVSELQGPSHKNQTLNQRLNESAVTIHTTDNEDTQKWKALAMRMREHMTRMIQEIASTCEVIGNLPAGVCDDGEEEHDVAETEEGGSKMVDPDDHRLVRAIHKLQNLRLAISFVAGESSEIYEGLDLPMEKLIGCEGTLERCYEVALELSNIFLQRGDQLYVEMDRLKASLESYEQKFMALEEEKATNIVSTVEDPARSTSSEQEIAILKEQILEKENALEEWQGQAEENAAEARHWRVRVEELQLSLQQLQRDEPSQVLTESMVSTPTAVTINDEILAKEREEKQEELKELRQKYDNLLAMMQQLEEQVATQTVSHKEALAKERALWTEGKEKLEKEKEKLQQELHEHQQSQETHNILNHLRGKLSELEAELENERNQTQITLAHKDSVIAQYQNDAEEHTKTLKLRQSEIVALQNKLIDAQQKLQVVQENTAKTQELHVQEVTSLKEELMKLQQQIHTLENTLASIEAVDPKEKSLWLEEKNALLATNQESKELLSNVTANLDVEKQLVASLKDEMALLNEQYQILSNETLRLQQVERDLQATINMLEEKTHRLDEELQITTTTVKQQHGVAMEEWASKYQKLQSQCDLLTQEKERFSQGLFEKQRDLANEEIKVKDLTQSIVLLEETNQEKIEALARKDAQIKDLDATLQEALRQVADKEEQLAYLKEAHEQERQAAAAANAAAVAKSRESLPHVPIFNNTVQLQDVEIRRLNTTVERLSKELQQKEQENAATKPLLLKKDTEITTWKLQAEAFHNEMERLQKSNDSLVSKVNDLEKQIGEQANNHNHTMSTAVGRFAEFNVLPTSERMQVTEAMHLLYDFMVQMNEKHNIHDYFKTEIHRDLTTQDLPDLALALKRTLHEIMGKMDSEIDGFAKILAAKDKELASLKATVTAYAHTNNSTGSGANSLNNSVVLNTSGVLMANLMSPEHSSPPATDRKVQLLRSAEKTPVLSKQRRNDSEVAALSLSAFSFVTPLKSARDLTVNSGHRLGSDWSATSASGGRRSVTVTPAAKEAARYHAELVRERKKLISLQEEHADLLGLIAQQEVELSVFREKLQKLLGNSVALSVEQEAKDHVEKQYGVYTNFREIAEA